MLAYAYCSSGFSRISTTKEVDSVQNNCFFMAVCSKWLQIMSLSCCLYRFFDSLCSVRLTLLHCFPKVKLGLHIIQRAFCSVRSVLFGAQLPPSAPNTRLPYKDRNCADLNRGQPEDCVWIGARWISEKVKGIFDNESWRGQNPAWNHSRPVTLAGWRR